MVDYNNFKFLGISLKKNNIIFTVFIFLIFSINFSYLLYINKSFEDEFLIEKEKINASSSCGAGYLMDTEAIYSWIEINETGTILEKISDTSFNYQSLLFPWDYRIYDRDYSSCTVVSNGYLVFPSRNITSMSVHIPSLDFHISPTIALFVDNLTTSESLGGGGTVYYEFFTSPNRLIIEYKDVYTYNKSRPSYVGSFEAILFFHSGAGDIKFQYKDVLSISSNQAIVGLDYGDNLHFNLYSEINQTNLPITEKAINFEFNEMLWVCGNENRHSEDETPRIPGINLGLLLLIFSIMILSIIYIVGKNNLHKNFTKNI